jgi:hypothetical protein
MARRTPPVAKQVVEAQLFSNAYLKARLIDFDTGRTELEEQHKTWLRQQIEYARKNSMYRIRLVGYASRLGNVAQNSDLSYARISNVLKFLEAIDSPAGDRVETFRAMGDRADWLGAADDSAIWRAVEVHIFIGDIPPTPPPPNLTPYPRARQPLPGGARYTVWEIASPGGVFVSEIVGGGFNVFFIRNPQLNETRGYLQPVLGAGASLSIPAVKMVWVIIQQIVTGWQFSSPDFKTVTTTLPVTWEEMGDCLVRVSGAGIAVEGVGVAYAVITFTAAGVWQYNENDNPLRLPGGVLFQYSSFGKDYQIGGGASVALGPLFRVQG